MPILLQRGTPYLFATCSVQSALKFRLPSLRPLADCLPTEFCQRLDTKYISTVLYLPAASSIFLSSFYAFLLLFPSFCRSEGRFFSSAEAANLIHVSLFQFSSRFIFFCIVPLLQFLLRSRFSNKRPVETIYLLRPR